jgi:hypothetical protein
MWRKEGEKASGLEKAEGKKQKTIQPRRAVRWLSRNYVCYRKMLTAKMHKGRFSPTAVFRSP